MDWILRLFGYVSVYKINKVCNTELIDCKELIDEIHSKGFEHLLKVNIASLDIKDFGNNLLQKKQKIEDKKMLIIDLKNKIL